MALKVSQFAGLSLAVDIASRCAFEKRPPWGGRALAFLQNDGGLVATGSKELANKNTIDSASNRK